MYLLVLSLARSDNTTKANNFVLSHFASHLQWAPKHNTQQYIFFWSFFFLSFTSSSRSFFPSTSFCCFAFCYSYAFSISVCLNVYRIFIEFSSFFKLNKCFCLACCIFIVKRLSKSKTTALFFYPFSSQEIKRNLKSDCSPMLWFFFSQFL